MGVLQVCPVRAVELVGCVQRFADVRRLRCFRLDALLHRGLIKVKVLVKSLLVAGGERRARGLKPGGGQVLALQARPVTSVVPGQAGRCAAHGASALGACHTPYPTSSGVNA